MTWTTLSLLVLQAAAITIVFNRGSIFEKIRESGPELWQDLARCPLCSGTWIGFGWYWARFLAASGTQEGLAKVRADWPSMALETLSTGALTGVTALVGVTLLMVLNGLISSQYDDDNSTPTTDTNAVSETQETQDKQG